MKKTIYSLFLFLFLSVSAHAQVQALLPPAEAEKTEFKKLIKNYEVYVNTMTSKTITTDAKKLASVKYMRENLMKGTIFFINDLDTIDPSKKFPFLTYMNKLEGSYGGGSVHTISSTLLFDKIKFDQWRRFYYAEVKTSKTIQWKQLINRKKLVTDSITKMADSVMVADTLTRTKNVKLTFFIRFDKMGAGYANYKLWAITGPGEMPELPPLEPLQQWWSNLSPDWKTSLSTLRKIEEYPAEADIEKLTYQPELDFTNAVMTTYEPLAKFTNVKKLTVAGASINTFEPISKMSGLIYLDITKSKIESIEGVQKLTKLEEFYCIGNKLTTIAPIATCVSLIKFNCSENDLEDISYVKDLINLKELNVSLNIKLKNIDAVKGLINMEKISFRKIEIKDLTPVQNMPNLVYLDAYNTGVTSLEPIRNMQKIFHLDLSSNKITTLDPIRNYKYLLRLYLNTSSIQDYSIIDNFTLLRELDISNCPQIKTLGGIHKLDFLTSLKCIHTNIDKGEIARFKKNHPNCGVTYY
ncbi:MAG: leucine-rich repeat domain-containing protein [Cytophagaceae bacterium]|nr:leucine-rich repeat domain-containing protein [Cytophagaceae bacterium]